MSYKQVEGQTTNRQIRQLIAKAQSVINVDGLFIEIGCWKGKSSVGIANAIYPKDLLCVDTWQGNIDEGNVAGVTHSTVIAAQQENIAEIFRNNMDQHTQGNFIQIQQDCFEFLSSLDKPVAFCNIDASHDYPSVKKTIDMLKPFMVKGGVMCGDDFRSANMRRKDLLGGVEKAVRESFEDFGASRDLWWAHIK